MQGVVTMVWVQWALLDEFEKDVDAIDWERVCMLINASPVVCKVKDEYGWYPLHFACYANAPLYIRGHRNQLWTENLRSNSEDFFCILRGFFVQINCRRYDHGARHYLL